jgi:hypothetical protein
MQVKQLDSQGSQVNPIAFVIAAASAKNPTLHVLHSEG